MAEDIGERKNLLAIERILRALGNRRRLLILRTLKKDGVLSVGAIAEQVMLSFASTSRHLRILAHADLVENEQTSTTVNYYLPKSTHSLLIIILKLM